MQGNFKQLIIDFHAMPFPQLIQRPIALPTLPNNVHKAWAFIGMRRSGKTWVMYQLIRMLQKTVPSHHILYINFEDDRLMGLEAGGLQSLLDAYFELYPELTQRQDLFFFLDEIQEVPGWEKFVRRLLDTTPYQIYLSGSSSKMLSKELATVLRGRTLTREIFPFSFQEYLVALKIAPSLHPSSKEMAVLAHHARNYLERGGFPETVPADLRLHDELLQGYIDTVIFRDIIERHTIGNALAVKRFFQFCLQNAAGIVSINKAYQSFQSQGISVSKNHLYDFLDYFEEAYCLFPVPLFSFSVRQSTVNPVKIYPVDPGLIRAYSVKRAFDLGAQLETTVFCHLRRQFPLIHYYKTASQKEVDFVIEDQGILHLYQACADLSNPNTLQREVSALEEAMIELKQTKATIVTLDPLPQFIHPQIQVIPLWRFLL